MRISHADTVLTDAYFPCNTRPLRGQAQCIHSFGSFFWRFLFFQLWFDCFRPGPQLNYDVHCKQWVAGGAKMAKKQAERLQQLQKAAAHRKLEGGTPVSPGGTKQKLVPISALIPAPRVDMHAPDLGKEVMSLVHALSLLACRMPLFFAPSSHAAAWEDAMALVPCAWRVRLLTAALGGSG